MSGFQKENILGNISVDHYSFANSTPMCQELPFTLCLDIVITAEIPVYFAPPLDREERERWKVAAKSTKITIDFYYSYFASQHLTDDPFSSGLFCKNEK